MFLFMTSKPPVDVKNMVKPLVRMIWLWKHSSMVQYYRLYTHFAILFNLFINFGHLLRGFTQSVNKSGDLSDINNYKAIAISPVRVWVAGKTL